MNKDWSIDLVGRLAREEDVLKRPIFINSQDELQFQIKLISETPEKFPNEKLFMSYPNDLLKYGFEDDYYRSPDQRIERLETFLSEYLLVFCPQKKTLANHSEIFIGKELRLIRKSESYTDVSTFIPVPVFSKEYHDISFDEITHKIQNQRFIGKIKNISTELHDTPQFILWREGENYTIIGEFDKHQYAHGGYCMQVSGDLKVAEFEDSWLEDCYFTPENTTLLFIPLVIYQEMIKSIEFATPLPNAKEVLQIKPSETTESFKFQQVISTLVESGESHNSADKKEERFLEYFIQVTREAGLQYAEKDLINFHTAMKSNTLNILAGMSGTGKSRLVQAYAKALGLDDDQFVIIPVRPSWTDDSDLIGYVDAMNMVYRAGDSGLINTLIQAQKEENRDNKIYLVCFDEMNLARVEHYFSQFLSVLEMEPQRRQLRLYSDDLTGRLYNTAKYEPIINIPENIMFVGTVNIDESTYHFSDKVLDRANVITLDVLPYVHFKNLSQSERKQLRDIHGRKYYEDFKSFRISDKFSLEEREVELFWRIHLMLQSVNKTLGVGPRIVKQIDMYIQNLPATPHLSRKQAVDLQVVQRILPKLRGPEGLLKELIGKVDHHNAVSDSNFDRLLEEFTDISDFVETRNVLSHKAKELKINGYTI